MKFDWGCLAVKPSFGFGELDEEVLDPSLSVLGCGPRGSPGSQGERIERFSRKVFVGGLPPDIDEGKNDRTSVSV